MLRSSVSAFNIIEVMCPTGAVNTYILFVESCIQSGFSYVDSIQQRLLFQNLHIQIFILAIY